MRDPDLPTSTSRAPGPYASWHSVRAVTLTAGDDTIELITRRNAAPTRLLTALHVDTTGPDRPAPTDDADPRIERRCSTT